MIRQLRRRLLALAADRGSGSVWVLTACIALAAVAVGAVAVGSAVVARHRAAAAADLAALAAAQRQLAAAGAPCAAATEIATAMDAEVVRCELTGDVVDVVVTVDLRIGSWSAGRAEAQARAGPIDGPASEPRDHE